MIDFIDMAMLTRKLSQRWPRCALYMDALKIFENPWHFHCKWAFVAIDRMKVRTKFEWTLAIAGCTHQMSNRK